MMPSQSSHPVRFPVRQNVRSLPNCQNHQQRWPLGNSQLLPVERRVSVQAGERDVSQGGSSVPSPIQGQYSIPSSSLNNSHVADITPSATQRWSMITPTTTLGTSSRNTPPPSGTSQTDSTRHVVSSTASGIASTPTPLSSLDNLPAPIPDPEARAIITNPLQTRATERNQRQRQWQLQTQAVSTPRSVVSSSHTIHRFGHSDMSRVIFAKGRHLELDMWNKQPFMSAGDFETVSFATRSIANSLAEAPHL